MPQQFSIKSILLLTAAIALAVAVARTVAADWFAWYYALVQILGDLAIPICVISLFALTHIMLLQLSRIAGGEKTLDRLVQVAMLSLFIVVFTGAAFLSSFYVQAIGIVGTALTMLSSITCLFTALASENVRRIQFALLTLTASVLAWLISSSLLSIVTFPY